MSERHKPDIDGIETAIINMNAAAPLLQYLATNVQTRDETMGQLIWVVNSLVKDIKSADRAFYGRHTDQSEPNGELRP